MNPNSSSIAERCMSCFCCSANVTPRVTGVTSSPVHLCHMSLCHHCTCVHFRRAFESQAKRCFDIRHHIGLQRFPTVHSSHKGRAEIQRYVPSDQGEEAPRSRVQDQVVFRRCLCGRSVLSFRI